MRKVLIAAILFLLLVPKVYAGSMGLVNVKSAHDVKTTIDRLEILLKQKKMTIFKRVNHAKGARQVGLDLRPTELLIFGNPIAGTPLMRCKQSVAIDLPQKALAWEDKTGQVWLSYNNPAYIAVRHKMSGCERMIIKMKKVLSIFVRKATEP